MSLGKFIEKGKRNVVGFPHPFTCLISNATKYLDALITIKGTTF